LFLNREGLFNAFPNLGRKVIKSASKGAATQIPLVYLGLLKGDKSDSCIFRMIIFGFLLFLLFSSVFGLLLFIWVNCKWASYKFT
jgi:hypothetical protein